MSSVIDHEMNGIGESSKKKQDLGQQRWLDLEKEFSELRDSQYFSGSVTRREAIPSTREKCGVKSLLNFLKSCVGKDLTKVTMPVAFNEPLSFLQRLGEDLEYADILHRAASCKSSIERLAFIGAFASSCYASINGRFWKPFNPLLGETFEYVSPEKAFSVVGEQVCHHPPVTAIHAESDEWVFWEEYKLDTRFRGQYIRVIPTGIVHLKLKNLNHHFSWRKPVTTIHNLVVGSLWVDHDGDVVVTNHQTGETCIVHFQPFKKVAESYRKLTGEVRDADGHIKLLLDGSWDKGHMVCRSVDENLKCEPLVLWIAEERPDYSSKMYGFTKFAMHLNEPVPGTLCPTDCRIRPDLRLLELGQIDAAALEKHRVEEKQRKARKAREMNKQLWKPRWFVEERDPDTGTTSHVYKGGYWRSKIQGQFPDCADIF